MSDYPNNSNSLFHYTNNAGLMGILESQNIWATHYKFLNDSMELAFCQASLIDRVVDDLKNYFKKSFSLSEYEKFAEICCQTINSKFFEGDCYIASFCIADNSYIKRNGLLSQWRAYGQDGGYAIEFDKDLLMGKFMLVKDEIPVLPLPSECVYSNYAKHSNIDGFSRYAMALADNFFKSSELPSDDLVYQGLGAYILCAVTFKHHAFKEEKEFRFAMYVSEKKRTDFKDKVKTRSGGIPYIKLIKNTDNKLPIKRIIVGPNKDKYFRAEKLRDWLRVKGFDNLEVTVSDIPYR